MEKVIQQNAAMVDETTAAAAQSLVPLSAGVVNAATSENGLAALEIADTMLYRAKRAGRNRVVVESVTRVSRRVLVVEDEMMIAMMVEDMLTDLGHVVVGPAMRLETALPLAREADFDMAMLDVNLGETKSFPIAAVLRDRGIPFFFATGYGSLGIDADFTDAFVLNKPFHAHDLRQAIEKTGR